MSSVPREYEARVARVIWAAHILHYLNGERNQAQPLPEPDIDDDFRGHAAATDIETENDTLTNSVDSIRSKFLDAVAELLSPSKGWDYVVCTGLRESTNRIDLDVARNDGFSRTAEAQGGQPTWYINQLQKYLAANEGEQSQSALCSYMVQYI